MVDRRPAEQLRVPARDAVAQTGAAAYTVRREFQNVRGARGGAGAHLLCGDDAD